MKNIILLAAVILILTACNNLNGKKNLTDSARFDPAQGTPIPSAKIQAVDSALAPRITFEKATHDFGTIITGDKVIYEFKFTNTGKSALIIENASASCGCTVPEFPRKPINPGEGGSIKVVYDSKDQVGKQHKDILITSNSLSYTTEVHLTGESKAKAK